MIASTQTNHPLAGHGKLAAKSTSAIDLATAKLKSAGLRITQPRLAILAALGKRAQPTSIEQLHDDVGADNCDLVTVYRCMAAFEEIGLVRRAFFHNGTALYEIALGQPTRYHVVLQLLDARGLGTLAEGREDREARLGDAQTRGFQFGRREVDRGSGLRRQLTMTSQRVIRLGGRDHFLQECDCP